MLDDARRFNFAPELLTEISEALSQTAIEEQDGVWPDNWPIVQAFLAVATQWRVATIGGGMAPALPILIGLDYAAVRVALDAEAIGVTPELWRGLRVMEDEAVKATNEVDR